uniref:Fgenesh protein 83 n=1 Tax=Beta vulgaris TaxID=161934 RepID=Q20CC9_BETVU|nr:Fgenesh protein 83 [Beta vulgaris]
MEAVNRLVEEKALVIFTRSSCCISHSVMQLVSSYGANATVYELDEMSNGQEVDKALQGLGLRPSIPAVFIGQKLVGGAKEIISLQVQGKLMPMLKEADKKKDAIRRNKQDGRIDEATSNVSSNAVVYAFGLL